MGTWVLSADNKGCLLTTITMVLTECLAVYDDTRHLTGSIAVSASHWPSYSPISTKLCSR